MSVSLVVTHSTHDGVVHVVSAPESRQCRSRCLVQTWARWNIDRLALKTYVVHGRHTPILRASSGTVHMLAEKLHNTSPRRGHTLAEFDSTNAVAQLTSRGQLLHLSLTSAAGSQSRQLVATFAWVVVRSVYNCLIYE
jgi:hypothetical protein